jgi:hypothetical protein
MGSMIAVFLCRRYRKLPKEIPGNQEIIMTTQTTLPACEFYVALDMRSALLFGVGKTEDEARDDASQYTTDVEKLQVFPCSEALVDRFDIIGCDAVWTLLHEAPHLRGAVYLASELNEMAA